MTARAKQLLIPALSLFLSACVGAASGGLAMFRLLDREYASTQSVALLEQRLDALERTARATNANVIRLLIHNGVQPTETP